MTDPLTVFPLGQRVLIKKNALPSTSPGGIALVAGNKPSNRVGTVVRNGFGDKANGLLIDFHCNEGDTVVFNDRRVLDHFEKDGEGYAIVSELDILAIVKDPSLRIE